MKTLIFKKGKSNLISMLLIVSFLVSSIIIAPNLSYAAGTNPTLTGEWSILANNSRGKFNITKQTDAQFTGTVNIDSGRTEDLTNGNISGDNISFTRMWTDWDLRQDYIGKLTIDSNGNAKIVGTFGQGKKTAQVDTGTWSWTATKVEPITTAPTPAPQPTPAPATAENSAEAFESGARIMWQPVRGLGYRLFRSTTKEDLGISVTDFYITSSSYADVNIESNTTYYYTVKPVLAEARPFDGIDEKLGETIATFVVKTGDQVYKPGVYKHFILLKLDSPNMSIDGVSQEVDPGRNTAPILVSGRTMVPIRAIVEAMGGNIGWEGSTRNVSLQARNNKVDMWIEKLDISVNGSNTKMDVTPIIKNERTFLPIRFVAENLNCKVDWINSTKEIVIVYEEIR